MSFPLLRFKSHFSLLCTDVREQIFAVRLSRLAHVAENFAVVCIFSAAAIYVRSKERKKLLKIKKFFFWMWEGFYNIRRSFVFSLQTSKNNRDVKNNSSVLF